MPYYTGEVGGPTSGSPITRVVQPGPQLKPFPETFSEPVVPQPAGQPLPIGVAPTTLGTPSSQQFNYDYDDRLVTARYIEAGATTTYRIEGHTAPPIEIYLGNGAAGPTVPSSLRFVFRGRTYVDRSGVLYHSISPTTNTGVEAGTFDYTSNLATVTDYGAGSNTVSIVSMLTRYYEPGVSSIFFRTPGSPLRIGSFTIRATTMDGVALFGSADINGKITGSKILGQVSWDNGTVRVTFGESVTASDYTTAEWYDPDNVDGSGKIWRPITVDPGSIFFGTVIYRAIPVDPAIVGLDPVRLPADGKVVGFKPGGVAIVHNTVEHVVASPAAGGTLNFGRTQIALVEVFDANSTPVADVWYTVNLTTGILTWANPLNLSAYTLPITVRERIEFASAISGVQVTGEIELAAPLSRDFDTGSQVSSALAYGDVQARYYNLFDQATYTPGVWSDVVDGSPAAGTYNDAVYPISVTNAASIQERWALRFLSPTSVEVIGEVSGNLGAFPISGDIAPINPVTQTIADPGGKPYFTIYAAGFGGGWAANNLIRFNTTAAARPMWAARTTKQGVLTVSPDRVRIQAYGNAS